MGTLDLFCCNLHWIITIFLLFLITRLPCKEIDNNQNFPRSPSLCPPVQILESQKDLQLNMVYGTSLAQKQFSRLIGHFVFPKTTNNLIQICEPLRKTNKEPKSPQIQTVGWMFRGFSVSSRTRSDYGCRWEI